MMPVLSSTGHSISTAQTYCFMRAHGYKTSLGSVSLCSSDFSERVYSEAQCVSIKNQSTVLLATLRLWCGGLHIPMAILKPRSTQFPKGVRIPSHPSPAASLSRPALNPEPYIKKTPEACNLSVRILTHKTPTQRTQNSTDIDTSCTPRSDKVPYIILLFSYDLHSYLWLFPAIWIHFILLSQRFHPLSLSHLFARLLFPLPNHRLQPYLSPALTSEQATIYTQVVWRQQQPQTPRGWDGKHAASNQGFLLLAATLPLKLLGPPSLIRM